MGVTDWLDDLLRAGLGVQGSALGIVLLTGLGDLFPHQLVEDL